MSKPLVSVVITTKNEEEVIETLLKSLISQTFSNFEIILVDNNSTDKTVEIVKKYKAKTFNKGPERSIQRNFGVKNSKGEYVIILDADMKLEASVLKDCVNKFKKDKNLAGLIVPEKSFGTGFWTKFKVFEREFYVGEESIEAARFFRRDVFLKFGGYDKNITGPEDYDLPLRMKKDGLKIGRVKSFIHHNEKKFSPFKRAKKKFYYSLKAGVYLKKHPEMAIKQGNLFLRPVFFRKWKKLISHPFLSLGMFFVKAIEMFGVVAGYIKGNIGK
ncbi:glycosyltransferase [Candidatus Microgenomates bacterium]|nr:glycosyltransferase [Candidatus Microgenomates bacterium]